MKTLSNRADTLVLQLMIMAVTALLSGCESAVPIASLPPTPERATAPASAATVPAGRATAGTTAATRRRPKESWSRLAKTGRAHLKRGELAEAEDSFTRAYDLTRGFRPGDPRTRASFRNLQRVAAGYLARGDSASFGRVMELLVYVSGEVAEARNIELAQLLQELAKTRTLQERPAEARDALLLALSILEEQRGPDSPSLVGVHSQLGVAHLELGDLEAAEAEIDKAAEIAARHEESPGLLHATTLLARARLELARARVDKAREALIAAVAIHEEHFGPGHASTARVVRELALFEQEANELEAAERHFERVVSIWDALANEQYQRALSRNELAWFFVETGQPHLAEAPARSALGLLEEKQMGGQPFAAVADTLATALRNQGKYTEAESLYQEALEEGAKAMGLPGWDVTAIAERYATLLEQTDRAAEAEEVRQRWHAPSPAEPARDEPTRDQPASEAS